VPVDDTGELPEAAGSAGLGDPLEAEIDAVGKDGGQEQAPLAWRDAGLEMGEGAGEADPTIDLLEEVGDADPG
jgi:hypothetical protein